VFPETSWTTIRGAGDRDRAALERFAERYRGPVLEFIGKRGFGDSEAEDLCHEVFLRLVKGDTLAGADPSRGKFRSLLLAIATHVMQDHRRKVRREPPVAREEPVTKDEDFDRGWVLCLAEQALGRLREQGSVYYAVLRAHLDGEPQDRQKLWIARRKLIALIRDEIARTCASQEELEEELRYLSVFLAKKV
jgi:RNA polymerase sigma-70 factor (ECF subfamily)